MKHWTKVQARDGATLSASDYATEAQSLRGMIQSADRTQIPAEAISEAMIADGAMHRTYMLGMETINSEYPGEQSEFRSSGGYPYSWQAMTYEDDPGCRRKIFTRQTLPSGKEGLYHIELKGNYLVHPYWNRAASGVSPKRLGLHLLFNGQVVTETWGMTPAMGSFLLVGTAFGQAGDNVLELGMSFPAPGSADSTVYNGSVYPVTVAHLFSMQAVVLAKWR